MDIKNSDQDAEDTIMTVRQVSKMLQLHERTIMKLASRGKIPGAKIGSKWRFRRSEIDALLPVVKIIKEKDNA